MAIDRAKYIGDLNVTIPKPTDPRAEGAGQLRALKETLLNTFPNIGGEVTATPDELNSILPFGQFYIGQILMFSGFEVPPRWVLCDGRDPVNGVDIPDLRGRFVKGSTSIGEYSTGGELSVDLTEYVRVTPHVVSREEAPDHTHTIRVRSRGWVAGYEGSTDIYLNHVHHLEKNDGIMEYQGGDEPHPHTIKKVKDMDMRREFLTLSYIIYVG